MADRYRKHDYSPPRYESFHRSRPSSFSEYLAPPRFESKGHQYLSPDARGSYGRQRSSSSGNVFVDSVQKPYKYGNPARRSADFEQYRQQSKELYQLRARYQDCMSITAKVSSVCHTKAKMEQESRAEVTFSKILGIVDATSFRLRQWAMETNLDGMHDIDGELKDTSKQVADNFNRLTSTMRKLCSLCSKAHPADLAHREDTRILDSEDDVSDNENGKFLSIRLPIGTEIQQQLSSIDTQMQTLSLLSEPLQYSATQNAFREAVESIVAESDRFFGSKEVLKRYSVDEKIFGSEAIRVAKDSEIKLEMEDKMKKMNFTESSMKPSLGRGRQRERHGIAIDDPFTHIPTYIKVKREHISSETLKYYDIAWEADPKNPDFIIILRELDDRETEILFEHTRRLRQREHVPLERPAPEERQQYTFVRKKKRSEEPHRSTSRRGRRLEVDTGLREFGTQ